LLGSGAVGAFQFHGETCSKCTGLQLPPTQPDRWLNLLRAAEISRQTHATPLSYRPAHAAVIASAAMSAELSITAHLAWGLAASGEFDGPGVPPSESRFFGPESGVVLEMAR
jgi:hypothetical protein